MNKSNDRIPKIEWRIAQKLAARARKNAKFAALPPEKKRVAIAKDVIQWLNAGKLTAVAQRYLVAPDAVEDVVNGYKCEGCALGSLFACAVERGEAGGTIRRSDGYKKVYSYQPSFAKQYVEGGVKIADTFNGRGLYEQLKGVFETEQLIAIETAFEGRAGLPSETLERTGAVHDYTFGSWRHVPDYVHEADSWHGRHKDEYSEGDRMRAIMQNIIRNNGTFVPAQD